MSRAMFDPEAYMDALAEGLRRELAKDWHVDYRARMRKAGVETHDLASPAANARAEQQLAEPESRGPGGA